MKSRRVIANKLNKKKVFCAFPFLLEIYALNAFIFWELRASCNILAKKNVLALTDTGYTRERECV